MRPANRIEQVFGQNGKHARATVGMGALPLGIAVEIEMVVEVASSDGQ